MARTRKTRKYTKKGKKSLSKTQVKAVKAIAKKVSGKAVETKYFKYKTETEPLFNALETYNLFYHGVSQTASAQNEHCIIGNKIEWRGIKIKWSMANYYVDAGGYPRTDQPLTLHVYVLRVPSYYATTSVPISLLRNDTTTEMSTFFFNKNVKVLLKKTLRLKVDRAGSTVASDLKSGTIWLPRRQMIEFLDLGVNWDLKNAQNYYLCLHNRSQSQSRFTFQFAWQNYFKDA